MHNFWCDSSEEQEWRCQKYFCSAQAHDKLQALSQLFATAIKPLLPVPPNVLKCLQKQPCLQIWFQLRSTQQPTAALPPWLAFLAVLRALLFLCPCHMYPVPALSHRLFSSLSHTHFPTCSRGLLSCLATHMLIFQVSLCFLLGVPVYRDLFYSCQRLSRHWCKVSITHAAPEIPALSISFNFSCYLRFFSLFSHSILCPYCHLSLTIDCSGLVIGTFNALNTYFSKSAQYLSELCSFDYVMTLFLLFFVPQTHVKWFQPGCRRCGLFPTVWSKLCKKGDGVIYSSYLFSSRPCHWDYQWVAN